MHMYLNREIFGNSYPIERDGVLVDVAGVLVSDIFWGGQVTELSATRMVTRTTACGGFDIHTFTGTKEEMRLLLEVLFCAIMVRRPILYRHEATLEKVRELLGCEPVYYADHETVLAGPCGQKWAHFLPFGIRSEAELMLADALYHCSRPNLQTLIDWKQEIGCSLDEVHEIVYSKS